MSSVFAAAFAEADRAAWLPAEHLSVSAWAEQYRVLGQRVSSEPGPYRMTRTPYLRELHDALGDPKFREVVCVAPAQSGKSEAGRNWMAWICDMSPGPMMVVFPSEASAKENMDERVIPMFSDSPRLTRLLSNRKWDTKRGRVRLVTCDIFVGWAGSTQALATRPIQFVLLDEVDKFRRYTGREADPTSLARVRIRTYGHRGKLYLVSTPTIPSGTIWRSYQACPDRRTYHVPCPRCGEFGEFAWDQVRWKGRDESDAESLHAQLSAFAAGLEEATYECPECSEEIPDVERWGMVTRGEWVSEGYPRGEHPASESVGFKIGGLVTPWTSFTELAREWVSARLKGLAELQHFYNSMLGLPFWGASSDGNAVEISSEEIYRKGEAGHKRGVVPGWATVLVAAADTGKREFQWGVRAYGKGYRSRLVDFGVCRSFAALRERTLDREFLVEGTRSKVRPMVICIDSGGGEGDRDATRTEEVYRFALTDPVHIKSLKGFGGAGMPLKPLNTTTHEYKPPGGGKTPFDVTLSVLDVKYFKDLVATRVQHEDPTMWEVFDDPGRDYVLQMASERKTLVERRIRPDGDVREIWRWVVKATGAPNHFWDMEVYTAVGAYMLEADREEAAWAAPAAEEDYEDDEGGWWSGSRGGSWNG